MNTDERQPKRQRPFRRKKKKATCSGPSCVHLSRDRMRAYMSANDSRFDNMWSQRSTGKMPMVSRAWCDESRTLCRPATPCTTLSEPKPGQSKWNAARVFMIWFMNSSVYLCFEMEWRWIRTSVFLQKRTSSFGQSWWTLTLCITWDPQMESLRLLNLSGSNQPYRDTSSMISFVLSLDSWAYLWLSSRLDNLLVSRDAIIRPLKLPHPNQTISLFYITLALHMTRAVVMLMEPIPSIVARGYRAGPASLQRNPPRFPRERRWQKNTRRRLYDAWSFESVG